MSALICGNLFIGGTTVFAEEIGDYQLDEMVVTATRTEESNIKVASVVSVITADDIKKKNILTKTVMLLLQLLQTANLRKRPLKLKLRLCTMKFLIKAKSL